MDNLQFYERPPQKQSGVKKRKYTYLLTGETNDTSGQAEEILTVPVHTPTHVPTQEACREQPRFGNVVNSLDVSCTFSTDIDSQMAMYGSNRADSSSEDESAARCNNLQSSGLIKSKHLIEDLSASGLVPVHCSGGRVRLYWYISLALVIETLLQSKAEYIDLIRSISHNRLKILDTPSIYHGSFYHSLLNIFPGQA